MENTKTKIILGLLSCLILSNFFAPLGEQTEVSVIQKEASSSPTSREEINLAAGSASSSSSSAVIISLEARFAQWADQEIDRMSLPSTQGDPFYQSFYQEEGHSSNDSPFQIPILGAVSGDKNREISLCKTSMKRFLEGLVRGNFANDETVPVTSEIYGILIHGTDAMDTLVFKIDKDGSPYFTEVKSLPTLRIFPAPDRSFRRTYSAPDTSFFIVDNTDSTHTIAHIYSQQNSFSRDQKRGHESLSVNEVIRKSFSFVYRNEHLVRCDFYRITNEISQIRFISDAPSRPHVLVFSLPSENVIAILTALGTARNTTLKHIEALIRQEMMKRQESPDSWNFFHHERRIRTLGSSRIGIFTGEGLDLQGSFKIIPETLI